MAVKSCGKAGSGKKALSRSTKSGFSREQIGARLGEANEGSAFVQYQPAGTRDAREAATTFLSSMRELRR
jgi:hypothetical protein